MTYRYSKGLVDIATDWRTTFSFRSSVPQGNTGDGFAFVVRSDGFGGVGKLEILPNNTIL